MLEAVNSVLSNAPYTKAVVDQQSVARSFAANPSNVQAAPVIAPYVSLYIKVDVNFDKALLQMRDRDTGDVVRQIPSEVQLEAYRRAQQVVAPQVSYTSEEGQEVETVSYEPRVAETSATTVEVSAPEVTSAPVAAPSTPISAPVAAAPASIDTQA